MTIAIQSANAALVALEQPIPQPSGPGAPVDGAATLPTVPRGSSSDGGGLATDTLSLSGAAAIATLGGPPDGLADAASAADAATSAGGVIVGLLGKLRAAALGAADPNVTPGQRVVLDAGFKSDLARIDPTAAAASAGGVNLIDGSAVGQQSLPGGATLTGIDLTLGGPIIGFSPSAGLTDPASAAAIAARLGPAIDGANQALAQITPQGQAIERHLFLVSRAVSSLSPGVAGAINLALDGDGARLQTLQIQQTLAGAGLGPANQTSRAVLALFQSQLPV